MGGPISIVGYNPFNACDCPHCLRNVSLLEINKHMTLLRFQCADEGIGSWDAGIKIIPVFI